MLKLFQRSRRRYCDVGSETAVPRIEKLRNATSAPGHLFDISNENSLGRYPGKAYFPGAARAQVSSARFAFTALFGMGRGGTQSAESPGNRLKELAIPLPIIARSCRARHPWDNVPDVPCRRAKSNFGSGTRGLGTLGEVTCCKAAATSAAGRGDWGHWER